MILPCMMSKIYSDTTSIQSVKDKEKREHGKEFRKKVENVFTGL